MFISLFNLFWEVFSFDIRKEKDIYQLSFVNIGGVNLLHSS